MAKPFFPSTVDTTRVTADSDLVTVDRTNVRTIEDYLSLVTSWQSKPIKARFLATISANVAPYADAQSLISTFPTLYDVDYAEGDRLDADGAWVGRSRLVPIPLQNAFFSVGVASLGVGYGYIKGPYDSGVGLSVLPDDLYRRLIFSKILANRWDGTSEGLLAILRSYFVDDSTNIIVDDAAPSASPTLYFSVGDPARGVGSGKIKGFATDLPKSLGYGLTIGFSGKIPSAIDLAILSANLIPLKAAGSTLRVAVATVDVAPLFGVGVQNDKVAGVGSGAIGSRPDYVAALFAG